MHQAHGGNRLTRRLLFTLVLITTPLASHALGLGRLTVNSGLDEPFNGQIDLVSPTAQEIKTLKASLASRADFDIAGVERLALLFDITYAVKQHSNGQYYIKLATHNPVREPFLHFLIQVDWNGGHLIREYSALLDPPQWVAGTPAEIDVPATEVSNNKVVAESVPEAQAAPIVEIAPLEELPPLGSEPGTAATVSPDTMAVPESASINTAPESKSEPAAAPATVMPTEVAQAPAQPEATAVVEPFVPPATKSSPVTEPVPATQPVAVAPVTTAPVKSSMSEPEPAVVSELAPAPEPVTPAVVSMGREYGPTKSGDTLTQVARSMNVDSSLTSQQVMLALLRANPSAFFGNNVNNLKTGKILTLPDQETIASVSKVQAAKEYQAQYDAWQEYKLKMAGASRAVAVVEPEAPKVAEKPAVKKSEQNKPTKTAKLEKKGKDRSGTSTKAVPVDLLKIVRANLEKDIPEESSKTPGVETKKDAGTEKRALTERVATLEEAIESKQMQNKDMRERVGKLQEQVKNTERLVDLENKDLAVAQKQAAEAKLQAEKAAAEKAAAEKAAAEKAAAEKAAAEKAAAEKAAAEKTAQAKAEQEKLAQEQAAKDATSTAAKLEQAKKAAEDAKPAAGATPAKKPATAVKPAKAVPPPPAEVSFLDDILGNILGNTMLLAILGALAVVAVGVGAMYALRRRRAAQEFSESILSSSSLSSEASSITDGSGQAAASDTSFLSDFSQGGMGNIHTDEVDPIAEAEVYLAYGRDEQAEEILKDAIVKDPSRQELKGKLLEIYFQRNDVAGFETLAEELYAALEGKGGKVWDKAEEMGQKLSPANPMFRGGKPAARAAAPTTMLVSETTGQTLSEPQDMLEAMNATQGLEAAPTETNSGLDFNMDFNPAPADSGAQPTSTDFDMQFDMNESPASTASDNTSSFDLDFNPGVSGSTDTADHSIDFNLSGSQEPTQSLTSDLDFSPAESTSSAGELEFSLGGLSDTVSESDSPVSGSDTDSGMPGWDETATKLDLAKAYIDMGDAEGARSILDEVMAEGNDNQRQQAQNLAAQIAA